MVEMAIRALLTAALLGGLAVAGLLLWRRTSGLVRPIAFPRRSLRIRESLSLGKGVRLALVSLDDRAILLGVTSTSISVLDDAKPAIGIDQPFAFDLSTARELRRATFWQDGGNA